MDEQILMQALMAISGNPEILKSISLPNINFPTMGGVIFWNNLASYKGWRIQQHTITQHCRILDPDNVRRAWGNMEGMEKIFKKLADNN